MVNQGVWRAGIYDSEECNDPNVFYTLLGQHFYRRNVAEIIHAFSDLTLVVKHPLDLLRATAQVNSLHPNFTVFHLLFSCLCIAY